MNDTSRISTVSLQRVAESGFSIIQRPDNNFWQEYTELWNHALVKSPFQAPSLLRYLSGIADGEVIAMNYRVKGKLTAAGIFLKKKNRLGFLSDKKTDSNFFIFFPGSDEDLYREFFSGLFAETKKRKWNLILNHIPDWAVYNDILENCGRKSGLFWMRLPYSVCPLMEAKDKTAYELALGNNEIRHRINRLKKMNARFEILEKDEDLENWVKDFTGAHILRWQRTETPSAFRDPQKIRFLHECMKAWVAHDLMVRVAVVLNNRRIGFLVGLIEDKKMIHHSTTFHPDYSKFSPGIAVIGSITEYMSAHDIRVLDFGDGNESYKYILAEKDQPVSRIFASPKYQIDFIIRSWMIRYIRNNKSLYRIYSDRIRKLFRH